MNRARTRVGAVAYRKSIDEKGTMYAPTAIGCATYIEVPLTCPIRCQVWDEDTSLTIGEGPAALALNVSDMSLLALAKLTREAIDEIGAGRRAERDLIKAERSTGG